MTTKSPSVWIKHVIKQDEIDKYLIDGNDFINESEIFQHLANNSTPSKNQIREILQKSLAIERLEPHETVALMNVKDEELWQEMFDTALQVKRKVYDNRIVFFAPLYCGNLCVNNCAYCGFRTENIHEKRRMLTMEEVKREAEAVVREGHKRMIVVYGEHPNTDADYMVSTVETIYGVKIPARTGMGEIRRVNINAAPMCTEDLKKLWKVGIGTYQVFQETYHKQTYSEVHPPNTLKGNYRWRLYALHRAMDAGIDDLAIGALFGLYDWRFEVLGLLYHAMDLERQFNIGPHTISFPRMQPAFGSDLSNRSKYLVNDTDFKKLVAILRLSVPYSGLIVTARENPEIKRQVINVGCTQTDASTKIGIGAYSERLTQEQNHDKVQFTLGDQRTLDTVIRELAQMGMITSFCTAGYRCGRTGDKIMGLLKGCVEGKFCKLNAVLTFREYLDDYASPETKALGEALIRKEIEEIKQIPFFSQHNLVKKFEQYYTKVSDGERDVYL
jgi:2-iminoacetate synthase